MRTTPAKGRGRSWSKVNRPISGSSYVASKGKLPAPTTSVSTSASASAAVSAPHAFTKVVGRFHWSRLINRKRATAEILAVPHLNRLLRFLVGGHFHETESLGAAAHLVHDDYGAIHGSGL